MPGITHLKAPVALLAEIANDVADIVKDRKITPFEIAQFVWERFNQRNDFIWLVDNWEQIKVELKDIDASEVAELTELVTQSISIESKKVQELIYGTFKILEGFAQIASAI